MCIQELECSRGHPLLPFWWVHKQVFDFSLAEQTLLDSTWNLIQVLIRCGAFRWKWLSEAAGVAWDLWMDLFLLGEPLWCQMPAPSRCLLWACFLSLFLQPAWTSHKVFLLKSPRFFVPLQTGSLIKNRYREVTKCQAHSKFLQAHSIWYSQGCYE